MQSGSIAGTVHETIRRNLESGKRRTGAPSSETSAPAAPNGTAGWYTSDVNVTLTGDDGATGSGVDRTEYKLNGGAFTPYTAPIALTQIGTHTIEYRSVDKNNNVEAAKTVTYKVDKAAPTSTATLQPATSPSTGPVTLTLTGEDQAAGSGLAKLEYQVNNASVFERDEIDSADRAKAEADLKAMCDRLLANTVIENYTVAII